MNVGFVPVKLNETKNIKRNANFKSLYISQETTKFLCDLGQEKVLKKQLPILERIGRFVNIKFDFNKGSYFLPSSGNVDEASKISDLTCKIYKKKKNGANGDLITLAQRMFIKYMKKRPNLYLLESGEKVKEKDFNLLDMVEEAYFRHRTFVNERLKHKNIASV
ncbi:hypothetical protein KBA27_06030 [bacterium]|nr:hypothetical protein [bacterium]